MYCSKCGSPLYGASVCPACGTPVTEQPVSSPVSGYEETPPYMEFGPLRESVSPPAVGPTQGAQVIVQPPALAGQAGPPVPTAQPISSQRPFRRQRTPLFSAFATFLILLVISAAGLLSYTAVIRPAALNAHATAVAQAFLTAQAQNNSPQYIYQHATSGKPTINDSLSNQSTSAWNHSSPTQNNCLFLGGAYHVQIDATLNYNICTSNLRFANFALQIQTTILSGTQVGILFRAVAPQRAYLFGINQSGNYFFSRANDTASDYKLFTFKPAPAIKVGQNQSNLLTIIALGNRFFLYINKQFLAQFSDNAYSSGTLALLAGSGSSNSADVAFNNLQIWRL